MDVNSKALRFIIATSACSKCQTFAQWSVKSSNASWLILFLETAKIVKNNNRVPPTHMYQVSERKRLLSTFEHNSKNTISVSFFREEICWLSNMNMGIALRGDCTRECMTVASQAFKMQEHLLTGFAGILYKHWIWVSTRSRVGVGVLTSRIKPDWIAI